MLVLPEPTTLTALSMAGTAQLSGRNAAVRLRTGRRGIELAQSETCPLYDADVLSKTPRPGS